MISIVIPVMNEEESLEAFFAVLSEELRKIHCSYEVIFIDDGSSDRSLSILKDLSLKEKNVRIYSFRRNHGKAEALMVGFQKAQGESIITLDADLEDQPSEIKNLLKKAEEGWDIVIGWRKERKHTAISRISSKIFNFFTRVFWGMRLHDYNSGLKFITADCAKELRLYGGMHRFIPLLAYQNGFTVTEIPVRHEKRKFGKSKYSKFKIFKDVPDMFTMLFLSNYSKRPLHFFGIVGGGMIFVGLIILVYLSILHFMGESINRRPLLLGGALLTISGFQLFFTGFIAELLINISSRDRIHFSLKYASDEV
jgi:glycosyltransferase involved in cell wall biosynthesis